MLGIKFPVYPLRSYIKRITEDKITYIETIYDTYVLDNKNLFGANLAERRLKSSSNLYPLNKQIHTYEELIKCKAKEYVDSEGIIFRYKKTKKVEVKCYEVLDIVPTLTNNFIIYTKEVKPIIYYCRDLSYSLYTTKYVLVFENNGHIIYGFSDTYLPTITLRI